jgi:hypothetical protein
MPLDIQLQKDNTAQNSAAVIVKLNGSLDTATAPELEKQLAPVLGGTRKRHRIRPGTVEIHQQRRPARFFHRSAKHLKNVGDKLPS